MSCYWNKLRTYLTIEKNKVSLWFKNESISFKQPFHSIFSPKQITSNLNFIRLYFYCFYSSAKKFLCPIYRSPALLLLLFYTYYYESIIIYIIIIIIIIIKQEREICYQRKKILIPDKALSYQILAITLDFSATWSQKCMKKTIHTQVNFNKLTPKN